MTEAGIQLLSSLILSSGQLDNKANVRVVKTNGLAGCMNDFVQHNRYLIKDAKAKISTSVIRPMPTYGTEARPETFKTKRPVQVTEMRIVEKAEWNVIRNIFLE